MKSIITLLIAISLFACSSKSSKSVLENKDSTSVNTLPSDSQLMVMSKNILNAFQQKDYKAVAEYISPELGLRFSPYAFIDTTNDRQISKDEFLASIDNKALLDWGDYDGSGEPIEMTFRDYFARFVCDIDFVKSGEVTVNEFVQRGNTTNNIKEAYPNCSYVDFFFKGSKPEVEGLDWKAVRLVYKTANNKTWLIGIIHDEWTV